MRQAPRSAGGLVRTAVRRLAVWVVLLAAVGGALRLGGCMDRVFFHPTRGRAEAPRGVEEVSFRTSDGVRLRGWLMKPAGGAAGGAAGPLPVVVHCHGNAGNIGDHAGFSDFLTEHGLAVLLFDYRGYGESDEAALTRGGLALDASAAVDFVLRRADLDPSRVGVLGVSLGGAFAARVAAERPEVRALALVSAFTGWQDVAGDHLPILGRLLIRRGMDPLEEIGKLGGGVGGRPLLVLHGREDEVIAIRHGERLAAEARRAGVAVEFVGVAGADHNGIMDGPEARGALGAFFVRALAGPTPGR